jgi:hypothetical protein
MADPKAPTPQPTPEPDEIDKILTETRERYGLPDTGTTTSTITQAKSKPLEGVGVEPKTDLAGLGGAALRGLSVPAAQAGWWSFWKHFGGRHKSSNSINWCWRRPNCFWANRPCY